MRQSLTRPARPSAPTRSFCASERGGVRTRVAGRLEGEATAESSAAWLTPPSASVLRRLRRKLAYGQIVSQSQSQSRRRPFAERPEAEAVPYGHCAHAALGRRGDAYPTGERLPFMKDAWLWL